MVWYVDHGVPQLLHTLVISEHLSIDSIGMFQIAVLTSGAVAFLVNLSIFWVIGNTSALTYPFIASFSHLVLSNANSYRVVHKTMFYRNLSNRSKFHRSTFYRSMLYRSNIIEVYLTEAHFTEVYIIKPYFIDVYPLEVYFIDVYP